jgi:hypothetical protein
VISKDNSATLSAGIVQAFPDGKNYSIFEKAGFHQQNVYLSLWHQYYLHRKKIIVDALFSSASLQSHAQRKACMLYFRQIMMNDPYTMLFSG